MPYAAMYNTLCAFQNYWIEKTKRSEEEKSFNMHDTSSIKANKTGDLFSNHSFPLPSTTVSVQYLLL